MRKEDVINFFDCRASEWDEEMIRDDRIINIILDNALVSEGKEVLDVACGTGVLFPDYLARKVKSVTGVDISCNMVEIAKRKFNRKEVRVLCADVETISFDYKFDCIVVYNAFPHFPDPHNLIKILTSNLKPGGTLTVAHGMSKEQIDQCHVGAAKHISNGLMDATELADIFEEYLRVEKVISNDEMYQVVGTLNK